MIKKKEIELHIVCLVCFLPMLQFILSGFNIAINVFVLEYLLIFALLILNKFKIKNFYNIIVIFLSFFLFLFTMMFYNNSMLQYYIHEYICYALPLLLIFLFDYDFKDLIRLFSKYCIICLIFLLYFIFSRSNLLNDYMSFGYNGAFCNTFLLVYSLSTKNKKILLFSLVAFVLLFIFGSRGSSLIYLIALTIYILFNIKKKRYIILIILLFSLIFYFKNNILNGVIDFSKEIFGNNNYAIKQIENMINSESYEELLGGRYYIYLNTIELIKKHPICGMGISGVVSSFGFFPHNIFLDVLSTFGIVFGSMYFVFLFALIKKMYLFAKNNMTYRIIFIFCFSIIFKLILSKTFIYDPFIWLLISIFINVINCKKNMLLNNARKEE